jgi:capsular polysaccharide export protein
MDVSQRVVTALNAYSGVAQLWSVGFSGRKQLLLRRYWCALGMRSLQIHRTPVPDGVALVWGATPVVRCFARVEDGFIRSVGLGADLVKPLSWVFDTRGIYFDATQSSDLEWLLQNKHFNSEELVRAAAIRQSLVAAGLTKYNVGNNVWRPPSTGRRLVLVAGQVETDASIRLGSHTVRTNMTLLQAARERCPDDYLIYKPHPDVLTGLRAGGVRAAQALQWCDEVVEDANMADLLAQVDAVHVMTSLTGFEALLRGLEVTCYGTPFYAGWGLCNEPHVLASAQARRTRRLSIDQLVAATLVDYPGYLHPDKDVLMSVEQAIEMLQTQREGAKASVSESRARRFVLRWIAKLQGRF